MQDHGEYISGAALLANVGLQADDRYKVSAAVVAVAAAVQSHLDTGNYDEEAVRRSLTALFLSGINREVLPTVAEATELKQFVDDLRELDLDLTAEQTGLIGEAFGITAPVELAMKIREATVVVRAEHIGNGILEYLLDDRVDVEGVRQDIVSGRKEDEGKILELLYEASEIPAADEPRAFAVDKIPVLDALLERVESTMVTGDAALREAKARAVLEACAGAGKGYHRGDDGGKYEFKDIHELPRQHTAALGVVSACLAVLLHADDVDPDVANALMASICAAGRSSILVPSAMECEKIMAGASLLDILGMMPERDTTRVIQAYLMRAVARKLTAVQLTEEAERLLEEAIEQASIQQTRPARESELDRVTGPMPETDDGPDEGDKYGANPFWLKDSKELFKKKKKQAARMGPEVHPSKANLPLAKQLATMPLAPVTTKAPPPYDLEAKFAALDAADSGADPEPSGQSRKRSPASFAAAPPAKKPDASPPPPPPPGL